MSRRPLTYVAFHMNTPGQLEHGLWRHPLSRQSQVTSLDEWIALAKTLEAGGFDALFFADVHGVYDSYGGGYAAAVREAVQVPINDPSVLISALAAATESLAFVVTSSIIQDHPFSFARRMSTLDHLTRGRIAWNVVTGYLENGARNFGLPGLPAHDERYRWAEEYLDVVYKLWEGSWTDTAYPGDGGAFANADQVRRINHAGERYRVPGPHLVQPSPQRTPVLFQAGRSRAGRDFAARHAEVTFLGGNSDPRQGADAVTDFIPRVRAARRAAGSLKLFGSVSVVVGSTEEEARRKNAEYDELLSAVGILVQQSGGMGIDLSADLETPLRDLDVQGMRGVFEAFLENAPAGSEPTLRDIARTWSSPRIVGAPEQIAEAIESWADAGVDGLNIVYQVSPGSFTDFGEHVSPELRRRGLMRTERATGTFRERLFGAGGRLPEDHPAARRRHSDEYTTG